MNQLLQYPILFFICNFYTKNAQGQRKKKQQQQQPAVPLNYSE